MLLFAFWRIDTPDSKVPLDMARDKRELFLAAGSVTAMALMEFFAVSTGLWKYIPRNRPTILGPIALLF